MPMEGQPEDICEKIEKLVVEYISKMEALILVVVAANTEIATSKALRLAKVADPQGRRTIVVRSMTSCVWCLEPAKYKIQKGFVLVKLRSQEDINNQVSLMQAVENEMCYFKDQSPYRALPDSTVGTNSLSNKLTWELVERIKTVLPSLKEETQKKMKETDAELKRMGEGIPKDSDELRKYISQKFLDFTKRMTRICDGLYDQEDSIDMRLLLHTRPAMEEFADAVNKLMPAASDEDLVERVTDEIRTQRGEELPHFLPYRACQVVVSNLLKEYTVPASNCLNSFNVIVDNFLRRLTEQYFDYFPRMKNEIKLVIDDLRTTAFDVCEAAIKDIFEIEYMVIIPDKLFFKMEAKESHSYSATGETRGLSMDELIQFIMEDREREAADKPPIQNNQFKGSDFTIRQIVIYFKSALDRITATVPMRIHYNLVKMLSRNIEIKVTSMALDSAVVGLLTEDDTTAKRRSDLEERLSRLDMSYKELARF
ncbi:Interferon-induced GTP-binding protein Mx [Lamellibrachia satsuma]|nr:Interferon-induced GTP-binding protein Mx [Lamellibrachia satsuma]